MRLPYVADSDTSHAAADSMRVHAAHLRGEIYDLVAKSHDGMTCDEAEEITGRPHQSVSPRFLELRKMGRIVDSGIRRKTRSGRSATVWVATSKQGDI
ncbi:MAG: hypothetical protein E6Q97_05045 [Desulfurellales bacterium]|nr:MAG: hypothetical protein E6Q97_05045 [Desulfurellales bacterium]